MMRRFLATAAMLAALAVPATAQTADLETVEKALLFAQGLLTCYPPEFIGRPDTVKALDRIMDMVEKNSTLEQRRAIGRKFEATYLKDKATAERFCEAVYAMARVSR